MPLAWWRACRHTQSECDPGGSREPDQAEVQGGDRADDRDADGHGVRRDDRTALAETPLPSGCAGPGRIGMWSVRTARVVPAKLDPAILTITQSDRNRLRRRRRRHRWRAGPGCPGLALADRIVVLGSAWEAASWTSRSGTQHHLGGGDIRMPERVGVTVLAIPPRRATRRTILPAPCRSSRCPSAVRNTGPPVRSPMARRSPGRYPALAVRSRPCRPCG
jgi:hypothetical protein